MIRALIAASMLAVAPAAAQEVRDSSGRFPVFGPSAEREAFFQKQADDRAAAADAIRQEQLELEKARIAAEAQEDQADSTTVIERRRQLGRAGCYRVAVDQVPAPTPLVPGQAFARADRVPRTIFRWVCPGLQRPLTRLNLQIDDGDVSGGIVVRRPGLGIDVTVD